MKRARIAHWLEEDRDRYWYGKDPILKEGEPGFDLSSNRLYIGDGEKYFNELPYFLNNKDLLLTAEKDKEKIKQYSDNINNSITKAKIRININLYTEYHYNNLYFYGIDENNINEVSDLNFNNINSIKNNEFII
jgi:hypothetical protein